MTENEIAKIIVNVAYQIHVALGPGLLESVYQEVMVYELRKRGLQVLAKEPVPIGWDDLKFEKGYEADLIIDHTVIVELKSVEELHRAHKKQLLTYLRLANKRECGPEDRKDRSRRIVFHVGSQRTVAFREILASVPLLFAYGETKDVSRIAPDAFVA